MSSKNYPRLKDAIRKSKEQAQQNEKEYYRFFDDELGIKPYPGEETEKYLRRTMVGSTSSAGGSSTRPRDLRGIFETQRPPGVPLPPVINMSPRPARRPRPTDSEKTEDGRIIVRDSSDPQLLYRALHALKDFHGRWTKKNPGNNDFMKFLREYNKSGEGKRQRRYFYAGSITSFETFQVKYRAANNAANAQKKRARAIKTNQIV